VKKFPFTDSVLRWLETILAERFGHNWLLTRVEEGLRLELEGAEGAIVFGSLQDCFTEARSDMASTLWDVRREGWESVLGGPLPTPGVAQLPSPLIVSQGSEYFIHYDILGLTYWMLARVEEIGRTDLDNHDRFPATSSHAYKHGYLDRPVVDEWLHVLGQVIQRQWPGVVLKQHEFQMRVSHDVDSPSQYAFKSWKAIGRMMAGHLLKRRDLKAFLTAPYVKMRTRKHLHPVDPFNTFDWLMDNSEANDLHSAFYFICGRTNPDKDGDYELEHPVIRDLMRRVHARGHEIGLHPSYGTFQQPGLIREEADRLKRVCTKEGIAQERWGGRMHYLRWEQPTTLKAWADAGMDYDSTLGYADSPGFRCGTCHDYPAFDPVAQETLNLRLRPLVAMECSVIDDVYMGLGVNEKAEQEFLKLKKRCERVGGAFNLLWHNSYLSSVGTRALYTRIIQT